MKGRFIVLDGPDGSGTSLHSKLLAERLTSENIPVHLTAEPSNGMIGQQIRPLLASEQDSPSPDALQLLFCADRADHVIKELLPALEDGITVICDRYSLSTLVYGAVLGLDVEWLRSINEPFPQPDHTIFTLPDYAVCRDRLTRRSSHDAWENDDFQHNIYNEYKRLSDEDPSIILLDTDGEKAAVSDHLYALLFQEGKE